MDDYWHYAIYLLPLVGFLGFYLGRQRRQEAASHATLTEAREAGLIEPVSLHPVIDPNRCLGCGACVAACPEQPDHRVRGLVGGKAQLISPTDCIGRVPSPLRALGE